MVQSFAPSQTEKVTIKIYGVQFLRPWVYTLKSDEVKPENITIFEVKPENMHKNNSAIDWKICALIDTMKMYNMFLSLCCRRALKPP